MKPFIYYVQGYRDVVGSYVLFPVQRRFRCTWENC